MRSEAFMTAPGSGDPHGLDVDELADAVLRELPSVAGALDAAEGQARVGLDDAVDEYGAGLDLRRQTLRPPTILCPERCPEPEGGVIGQAHGIAFVFSA